MVLTAKKDGFDLPEQLFDIVSSRKEPVRISKEGFADIVILNAAKYEELERQAYVEQTAEKVLAGVLQTEQGLGYEEEEVLAHLENKCGLKIAP